MNGGEPRLYFSDRDLPLVYVGPPPNEGYVLTVENYIKWYTLYRVDSDGKVTPLPHEQHFFPDEHKPGYDGPSSWADHVPGIDWCLWLAKAHPEYEWCPESLDMIAGRKVMEARGYF